jgi:5-methylthioadenosine/S-adenosylhomocysteine deaminase
MQRVDTLIEASHVVPVVPRGSVIQDGAIAIAAGEILAVGAASELRAQFDAVEHVVLPEHVLLPGLVNAHAHSPMTLMRGLADDLPLMTWLSEHIWPAEARLLSPEFVRDGAALAVLEMIRGGTTAVQENYFFPDALASTFKTMGMRALVGLPVIEFPSAWAASTDAYFEQGLALLSEWRGDDLIAFNWAPHAPYTVSDASFTRIAMLADQLDLSVHCHIHETAFEVAESVKQHGLRPLERLRALGVVNERLNATHMTQLSHSEIELCARAGVRVMHCPHSNLKLASGFAPVAALMSAGVSVAIGTDGASSNNALDLWAETRTAALLAKAVSGDAKALSAPEALEAATLGGARALGLEHKIGSLEIGKRADVIAVDLSEARTQPVFQVISQLIYACSGAQVREVWIDGVRKLKAGQWCGLDHQAILEKARIWAVRVRS